MFSTDGDSPDPDSTPRSVSLASSSPSSPLPSFPNSTPTPSCSSTSTLADTPGIVQDSKLEGTAESSRDTEAAESFRALSISKPADSLTALPPLASFFDIGVPEQHLSGLEDEDGPGPGEKKVQESVPPLADLNMLASEQTTITSPSLSATADAPVTKPILNPSAVPFFSVNSGLGASNPSPAQDATQDPVLIHTQPRVPPPLPNLINPLQLQLQLQAMQQLPLASQQQLIQLLVQNQLLMQQQALFQPSLALQQPSLALQQPSLALGPLALQQALSQSLPAPLATPTIPRSPVVQELTFPPRSPAPLPSAPEQLELTPSGVDLKLQKQREALARGGVTFPPKSPQERLQDLPPSQEAPFPSPSTSLDVPQNKDFLRYLSPIPKTQLDPPPHFIAPLSQIPANAVAADTTAQRPLSAEDSRQAFLQFQQWQKQQKLQGFDSSDMLRWVNEQAAQAHPLPANDVSPRPNGEQWQKSPTDTRFLPTVRVEHALSHHSEYEQPRVSPRPPREEFSESLSPHSSLARPVLVHQDRPKDEPWKPQLTIDPPESWQKPQLTIDPPERVVGELNIPMSRSRSREEQWQLRKQTLEPERGSISPANSPSRPGEWGLKQRSSFDSSERGSTERGSTERGSTELHPRLREEWHSRHSNDSSAGEPPLPLGRSRNSDAWSPRAFLQQQKSLEERQQEFMNKPRQSFDSTLDVPQAPMSGRSRSTPTGLKKMGSRFNFVQPDVSTPENDEITPSSSTPAQDPNGFQPPSFATLINQELLRQGLLVQLTNLQAQQARQAMQAALAQPSSDEATINAALAASQAASQLAQQQHLQYCQTMALRGQLDPTASTPSGFESLSPMPPNSPGGQEEHSKSPRRGGSFSSMDKMKRNSQERSRGSSHSLSRRDAHSPSPPSPSPSPTNASSVPWLEAFRAAKGMDQLSLKEVVVRGWLKDLATDQYGSRFLQRRLEAASQEHKHLAFDQLMQTGILPLCTDVFGNYVVQKFFDYSGPDHRATLATKLLGNVLQLSMQMYGCRVVQKAIELSEPPVQTQLVRELDGHVIECAEDQNGNHVIQKCLEKVAANKLDFMVDAFKGQIARLATHPYGCRVIQRLLERWGSEESIVSELLGEHTDDLCRNQYGNYVIQHLLIHGSPWQRSGIIHALLGKLFVLSKHKFASNVVENCFVYGSPQDRTALIQEVLGRHPDESCLLSMVRDQYANYVVQKMIDLCDPEQLSMIVQRIKRHVPGLRKIPYGKNILTRLEKLTGTVFSGTTQLGSDAFPNNEMSSAATIPFPGTENVSPSLHMNPWPSVMGHSPMARRSESGRSASFPRSMSSIGRDNSRDRGCPSFSGRRPLSIEADASGFSAIDDRFDSYYANLQSAPDGHDFEDE